MSKCDDETNYCANCDLFFHNGISNHCPTCRELCRETSEAGSPRNKPTTEWVLFYLSKANDQISEQVNLNFIIPFISIGQIELIRSRITAILERKTGRSVFIGSSRLRSFDSFDELIERSKKQKREELERRIAEELALFNPEL